MSAKTDNPLQNRRRSFLPWFVAVAVIALVAAAEIHCRRTLPPRSWVEVSPRAIRLKEHRPLQHAEIPVPETPGLRDKKVILRTDEDGFIEPSAVHARPDLKIVFLGGSTTECLYLPEQNRLPYRAGRLLEKRLGITVNSYNAGVSGNHTLHSLNILINKIFPLEPDAVVLNHNHNDLVFLIHMGSYWRDHPTRSLIVSPREETGIRGLISAGGALLREAVHWAIPGITRKAGDLLVRLAPPDKRDEWAGLRAGPEDFDLERAAGEFEKNLRSFIAACRARGIEPVLATQAGRMTERPEADVLAVFGALEESGIPYSEFRRGHLRFNRAIRETAGRDNVKLIDLEKNIPPDADHFYDPVHFTARGSETAAELMAKIIGDMISEKAQTR